MIIKYKLFIYFILLGFLYFILRLLFGASFHFNLNKLLNFIILAPILEEILFRGIIQKELLKKFSYKYSFFSVANILTSIIFSMSHLFNNSLSHSLLVFIPSILFGIVYERYNSVLLVILLHSIYNLNIFIY